MGGFLQPYSQKGFISVLPKAIKQLDTLFEYYGAYLYSTY